MKKLIIVFLGLTFSSLILAQDVFTLDYCLKKTEENYPLIKNEEYIQNKSSLNKRVSNTGYYPNLNIIGQATWQSEVTNIDIDLPFITEPLVNVPKDQYKIALDFSQTIWDGGLISKTKLLSEKEANVELAKLKTDIYSYKVQVVELYYSFLMLRKQEEIVTIKRWQLREPIKNMRAGIDNGVILPVQLNILLAEEINIEQKIMDITYEILAIEEMLEYLMGEEIPEFAEMLLPTPKLDIENSISRPEISYFNALKDQASASNELISKTRMPKLMAFAQLGYGRPGLNMLSEDFSPFAIVGARLLWNPWDWNRTKHKKEITNINIQMLDVRQQQFELMQNAKIEAQLRRIEKLIKLIEKDEELIVLRKSITESFESQLQNGIVTSIEYIIALNEEQSAMLGLGLHEILLSKAKYDMLLITGKDNK